MLRSLNELKGYSVQTEDGHKGKVSDFYFDDVKWSLRYLVVDTGDWLPGRLVLISPVAFGKPNWEDKSFPLNLTKKQIEDSPSIESNIPVSRQTEIALFSYYQWNPYWMNTGITAGAPSPVVRGSKSLSAVQEKPEDPHLQSMLSVLDYRIQAKNGEIGHIQDFIVDDDLWVIRYAVVDTKNWLPGGKVLVAAEWIKDIKWKEAAVKIPFLTQEQIKKSPAYDPAEQINRTYENRYYDYYGRPAYWNNKE